MAKEERCPGCQQLHDDYEQTHSGVPAGPDARGVFDVYECGRCGETIEVGRL